MQARGQNIKRLAVAPRYRRWRGCRIYNFKAPRSARSNSSSGSLHWVTYTYPIQGIPDNSFMYPLQSYIISQSVINNKIELEGVWLLSLILQIVILLSWVATLVTHLLIELHTAHPRRRWLQGLLIVVFTGARLKSLRLPAKQLNGCTMSTLCTRRT